MNAIAITIDRDGTLTVSLPRGGETKLVLKHGEYTLRYVLSPRVFVQVEGQTIFIGDGTEVPYYFLLRIYPNGKVEVFS